MKAIPLVTICVLLTVSCVAYSGIVDLSPDESGDRIAVVKDGKVAYLQATRINIGSGVVGGGSCRYIRRATNGDLYVTGPGLGLFHSTDDGLNWTESPVAINDIAMMSAFTILDDDTFLISYMPPPLNENKRLRIARSTDYGKTWNLNEMEPDLAPCKYMLAWNGDMIQLSDGTVLHTLDTRVGPNGIHDEQGAMLPPQF